MYNLITGDCINVMGSMPETSIDLIFADPPYRLSGGGFTCKSGNFAPVYKGEWDKTSTLENSYTFAIDWLTQCKRLLKPHGTIWVSGTLHNIYILGYALQQLGFSILNEICWFKPNAAPNLSCRSFTHSHETLIWAKLNKKSTVTFNYAWLRDEIFAEDKIKRLNKQMRSVWQIPTVSKKEKLFGGHPTQKPVALLRRIILGTSKEGDTVLDPFVGSGTTGVVAVQTNRNFIGIDTDQSFIDIATKRIEQAI